MKESGRTSAASAEVIALQPDPSWRSLYLAGGICAILYILIALVAPTLMVLISRYNFDLEGPALLAFIASNRTYWMFLQAMVLESSILAIITFVALFAVLAAVAPRAFAPSGAKGRANERRFAHPHGEKSARACAGHAPSTSMSVLEVPVQ